MRGAGLTEKCVISIQRLKCASKYSRVDCFEMRSRGGASMMRVLGMGVGKLSEL